MSEWRDVAALRAWLVHDGDIDGEALPIRSFLARLDRTPRLDVPVPVGEFDCWFHTDQDPTEGNTP